MQFDRFLHILCMQFEIGILHAKTVREITLQKDLS